MDTSKWIRSDGDGFFPPEVGATIKKLNSFPVARWNFLVVDPPPAGASDRDFLDGLCDSLKGGLPAPYQFQCHLASSAPKDVVASWAKDLALREPLPAAADVKSELGLTLTKAGLPIDPALRQLLRSDPFGAYQQLLDRLETQKPLKLSVRDDFLVEPDSGRVLIPMLLANDPLATGVAEKIEGLAMSTCKDACPRVGFLGGHFATLENKRQVMEDVRGVSGTGVVCLVAAALVIMLTRKFRLLWILVPVSVGTLLAGAAMLVKDGSLHGLTLSFGTGLIGLSVDYGVYTAFQARTPGVWRSNAVGILTTLVVLAVLAGSAIPILRQLMLFASLGLGASFAVIFALHRMAPDLMRAEPLRAVRLPRGLSLGLRGLTFALAIAGAIGLYASDYDLNVQRLSFMRPKTAELYQWFGKRTKLNSLFVLRDAKPGVLADLHQERAWSDGQGLRLENAAYYLPPVATQTQNRATWLAPDCTYAFAKDLDDTERKFFAPYLAGTPCDDVKVRTLSAGDAPPYVQHLATKDSLISIFFPTTDVQRDAVKSRYAGAFSLQEIAARFPTLFKAELTWMTPLSIALVVGVLGLYYRSAALVAGAVIPFFAGCGAVVLVSLALGTKMNFVTLVALLMLCGLSTDWGVFAVDGWRRRDQGRTQSALLFCALSSILGVVPMAFATHPVLRSLGAPLSLGLAGALAGSLVAVPAFLDLTHKRPDGRRLDA